MAYCRRGTPAEPLPGDDHSAEGDRRGDAADDASRQPQAERKLGDIAARVSRHQLGRLVHGDRSCDRRRGQRQRADDGSDDDEERSPARRTDAPGWNSTSGPTSSSGHWHGRQPHGDPGGEAAHRPRLWRSLIHAHHVASNDHAWIAPPIEEQPADPQRRLSVDHQPAQQAVADRHQPDRPTVARVPGSPRTTANRSPHTRRPPPTSTARRRAVALPSPHHRPGAAVTPARDPRHEHIVTFGDAGPMRIVAASAQVERHTACITPNAQPHRDRTATAPSHGGASAASTRQRRRR